MSYTCSKMKILITPCLTQNVTIQMYSHSLNQLPKLNYIIFHLWYPCLISLAVCTWSAEANRQREKIRTKKKSQQSNSMLSKIIRMFTFFYFFIFFLDSSTNLWIGGGKSLLIIKSVKEQAPCFNKIMKLFESAFKVLFWFT